MFRRCVLLIRATPRLKGYQRAMRFLSGVKVKWAAAISAIAFLLPAVFFVARVLLTPSSGSAGAEAGGYQLIAAIFLGLLFFPGLLIVWVILFAADWARHVARPK